MSTEKILDGAKAFIEGIELTDDNNPYAEGTPYYYEWENDWLEAQINYTHEGRFRDGSFKG
jgi:hypothetical protein